LYWRSDQHALSTLSRGFGILCSCQKIFRRSSLASSYSWDWPALPAISRFALPAGTRTTPWSWASSCWPPYSASSPFSC